MIADAIKMLTLAITMIASAIRETTRARA